VVLELELVLVLVRVLVRVLLLVVVLVLVLVLVLVMVMVMVMAVLLGQRGRIPAIRHQLREGPVPEHPKHRGKGAEGESLPAWRGL
jgi:hypothetical protein